MEQIIAQEQKNSTLSKALSLLMRYCGMGMAGLGAIILLVEGSRSVDSIGRFFAFAAIISLCAGLGFFLSIRRKDHKNARLLIGLFLGCVPIFYSQLGGLLYAGLVGVSKVVPQIFQLPIASPVIMILGCVTALVLIIPLSSIVARIFVPRFAVPYAATLSLLGVALCLPFRTGAFADLLLFLSAIAVLIAERRSFSSEHHLQTAETRVARLILFAFPLIFVGRALCYSDGVAVGFTFLFSMAALTFWLQTLIDAKSRRLGSFLSDIFVAAGVAVSPHYLSGQLPMSVIHTLSYLIPGAYFLAMSALHREGETPWIVTAFYVFLGGSFLAQHEAGLFAKSVSVVLPIFCLITCYQRRYVVTFILSLLVVSTNFTTFIAEILQAVVEYRWSILMVGGIGLVFGSSYVELGIRRVRNHWSKRTPSAIQ